MAGQQAKPAGQLNGCGTATKGGEVRENWVLVVMGGSGVERIDGDGGVLVVNFEEWELRGGCGQDGGGIEEVVKNLWKLGWNW